MSACIHMCANVHLCAHASSIKFGDRHKDRLSIRLEKSYESMQECSKSGARVLQERHEGVTRVPLATVRSVSRCM